MKARLYSEAIRWRIEGISNAHILLRNLLETVLRMFLRSGDALQRGADQLQELGGSNQDLCLSRTLC